MDKKGGLVLSVIILLAIFIVGFVFGAQSGFGQDLSPPSIGRNTFVNANECTADDTCEVNNLKASGDAEIEGAFDAIIQIGDSSSGHIELEDFGAIQMSTPESMNLNFFFDNPFSTRSLYSMTHHSNGSLNTLMDVLYSNGNIRFIYNELVEFEEEAEFNEEAIFYDTVTLNSLGGNSSAYACLNQYGLLFRSQTPCV